MKSKFSCQPRPPAPVCVLADLSMHMQAYVYKAFLPCFFVHSVFLKMSWSFLVSTTFFLKPAYCSMPQHNALYQLPTAGHLDYFLLSQTMPIGDSLALCLWSVYLSAREIPRRTSRVQRLCTFSVWVNQLAYPPCVRIGA